jgi:hypothetical protein
VRMSTVYSRVPFDPLHNEQQLADLTGCPP